MVPAITRFEAGAGWHAQNLLVGATQVAIAVAGKPHRDSRRSHGRDSGDSAVVPAIARFEAGTGWRAQNLLLVGAT